MASRRGGGRLRGVGGEDDRQSENSYDFALVAMLGLLRLRIFEATGVTSLAFGGLGTFCS
jgi:hypothetical protein